MPMPPSPAPAADSPRVEVEVEEEGPVEEPTMQDPLILAALSKDQLAEALEAFALEQEPERLGSYIAN